MHPCPLPTFPYVADMFPICPGKGRTRRRFAWAGGQGRLPGSWLRRLGLLLACCLLAGCGTKVIPPEPPPGPAQLYGKPYTVRGKTYYPLLSAKGFTETGLASWYGPGFHGRRTSSGERFNMHALTAAHTRLPFGTEVRVTRLDTGDSLVVRINDRGPFVDGKVIDLSHGAAKRLGIVRAGSARVRLDAL